jgi:hypothetical protein
LEGDDDIYRVAIRAVRELTVAIVMATIPNAAWH